MGAAMFVLGIGAGGVAAVVALVLFGLQSHRIVVVDRWWLENAERWAWLREYELTRFDGIAPVKGITATDTP